MFWECHQLQHLLSRYARTKCPHHRSASRRVTHTLANDNNTYLHLGILSGCVNITKWTSACAP